MLLADELSTGMDNEGWKMKLKITLSVFLGFQQKFEIHEYNIMEEFIQTLKGEDADKLEQVIQGRGAFRRFKDMVNRRGITKQWYDFQADYYRNLAIAWCQEHGIEYVENCM